MAWKQEREQLMARIRQLETENETLRHSLESRPQNTEEQAPAELRESTGVPQPAAVLPVQMAAALTHLTNVLGQVASVLGQFAAQAAGTPTAAPVPMAPPEPVPAQAASVPVSEIESPISDAVTTAPEPAVSVQEQSVPTPDQILFERDEETLDAPAEETDQPDDAVSLSEEPAAEPALEDRLPEDVSSAPVEEAKASVDLTAEPEQPAAAVDLDTPPLEEPADPVENTAETHAEKVLPQEGHTDLPEDIVPSPVEEMSETAETTVESESPVSESVQDITAQEDATGQVDETADAAAEEVSQPDEPAVLSDSAIPEEEASESADTAAEPETPISELVQDNTELEDTADQAEAAMETPAEAASISEETAETAEAAQDVAAEPDLPIPEPSQDNAAPEEVSVLTEEPVPDSKEAAEASVEEAATPEAIPASAEETVSDSEETIAEPAGEQAELEEETTVPEDTAVPAEESVSAAEEPTEGPAEGQAVSEEEVPATEQPVEPVQETAVPVSDGEEDAATAEVEVESSESEDAAPAEEELEQNLSPAAISDELSGEVSEEAPVDESPEDESAEEYSDEPYLFEEDQEPSDTEEPDPENILTLGTPIPDPDLRMVTKDSPTSQKVDLFWEFFCPREDVYARRWEDQKTGKAGYSFQCENNFDPTLCPKSWAYQGPKPAGNGKGKSTNACNGCPNRVYAPLTKEAVKNHLRKTASPNDVIGMYSILPRDTCRFLALDFDDGDWQNCVRIIRKICREWTIPCAVERSRSGNGAHVWIFFSEEVLCKDARKLGSFLITEASLRSKAVKLTAYDRMFPAQDTMPSGGLGSLIALPFQGCAAQGSDPQQFNSVFVDENFQTIPDQWAYLAGLYRLSNADLLAHLQMHQHESATGILVQNQQDGDDSQQFTRFRKQEEKITAKDFRGKVKVYRANMLYLPLKDLTSRARDRLMRLATFTNREFYHMQAMRKPIWDIPRVITAAEDRGEYLAIPRGCQKAMEDLFQERQIPYSIEDHTTAGTPIQVSFVGKLWPDQMPAAGAMLKYEIGVLSATTAFGKTVVGSWIIAQRKVNTLVLVDKETLLQQWVQRLEEFLLLPEPKVEVDPNAKPKRGRKPKALTDPSPIGQIGGGVNRPTGVVDVATFQSLWDKKTGEVNPIIHNYGMIIVDECHHVAADVFQQVVKEADARYLLGLSARPNRQDGKGPLVRFLLGPIRYQVDVMEQAEKDGMTRVLIPRFTNFRQPFNMDGDWEYNDACAAMIDDEDRNARIVQDVKDAIAQGRSPLVLTQRVEHAKKLESLLSDLQARVITLTGQASHKERRAKQELLVSLRPDEPLVLIATGQYAGEGFDMARLDTLMMAMPVASKDVVYQFVGRLHRVYQGKSTIYVYDYVDHQIALLLRMYQKRLRAYAENGYGVRSNSTVPPEGNRLFTEQSYRNTFQDDLSQAKSQVILAGRLLTHAKVQDFLKRLRPGVTAEIFLPATEDLKSEEESSLAASLDLLHIRNIPVYRVPGCCQEFAVLDQKLLWYGGLDLLGKPDTDCGCMRLQSSELAADLLHLADEWRDLATAEQTRIPLS